MASIDKLAAAYARAKAEATAAAKAASEASAALIDALLDAGQDLTVVRDAYGDELRVTVVQASTVVTDYEALKGQIDAKTYKETLTTRTYVDPEKVEALVALGKIKAEVVAGVSEVKPKKPYLKVSGSADLETLGGKPSARKGRVK